MLIEHRRISRSVVVTLKKSSYQLPSTILLVALNPMMRYTYYAYSTGKFTQL